MFDNDTHSSWFWDRPKPSPGQPPTDNHTPPPIIDWTAFDVALAKVFHISLEEPRNDRA